MSEDVEQQVRDIKARIQQAQARRARAEVERDTARAAADKARDMLKTEYGVETPDEARAVLAQLELDLDQAIQDAQQALERTNA
jgi:F0F1-type ATP synthase membrane subunit b/b'